MELQTAILLIDCIFGLQGISIVIRDFQNPQDFAFGFVGGQEYVAYELGVCFNISLSLQFMF